jgi:hypothetical protein
MNDIHEHDHAECGPPTKEEQGEIDGELISGLGSQLHNARMELAERAEQMDTLHGMYHRVGNFMARAVNLLIVEKQNLSKGGYDTLEELVIDVEAAGVMEFDHAPTAETKTSRAEELIRALVNNDQGEQTAD